MRRIEKQARIKAGLDSPPKPDSLVFCGFETPGLTDEQILRAIYHLEDYGIPLVAGGQLDQPAQFWNDVDMYRAIYNYAYNEAQKKLEAKHKHAG